MSWDRRRKTTTRRPWEPFSVLLRTTPPTSHPFATLLSPSSRPVVSHRINRLRRDGYQIFACLGWKWLEPKWLRKEEEKRREREKKEDKEEKGEQGENREKREKRQTRKETRKTKERRGERDEPPTKCQMTMSENKGDTPKNLTRTHSRWRIKSFSEKNEHEGPRVHNKGA